MTATAWAAIGLLSLVWGGAFFFTEVLEPYVGPLGIAAGRVAIAAAALWALGLARGATPPLQGRVWARYLVAGLITFAIPFSCFAVAQTEITGGVAAIINAMTPILVVIVSHYYPGGERATWLKAAGVAVGFCGVVVLIAPSAGDGFTRSLIAQLMALMGPVFYAFAGNYSRRFAGEDPSVTVTGTLTAATLWTLPVALIVEGPPAALPPIALGAFLAIGLVSTALAFQLFYALLPKIGATNFSIVTFLVPITAIGLGAAFLGERVAGAQIAGMAVIFSGLILVDGRLPRRLFARRGAPPAP